MKSVVIVGGVADVRRQVEEKLARDHIEVIDHWEAQKSWSGKTFPVCDAVLVLTDMCGHDLSDYARRTAENAGLPVVSGNRKWSWTRPMLVKQGLITEAAQPTSEERDMNAPAPKSPAYVIPAPPLPEDVLESLRLLRDTIGAHPELKSLDARIADGKVAVGYEVVSVTTGGIEL